MAYTREQMKRLAVQSNLGLCGFARIGLKQDGLAVALGKLAGVQTCPVIRSMMMDLAQTARSVHDDMLGMNALLEEQLLCIETQADAADAPPSPGHKNILSEMTRSIETNRSIWFGMPQ